MKTVLSERAARLQPSPTLAVTARAAALKAEGKDIIGLGAGEPDFDTPEHIKEAAIRAMRAGQTKYTAVEGTLSLRKAIVEKFKRDNGLTYTPAQILVSSGGKQSFFNLCQAVVDPGDEVIVPAPYWVSYPEIVAVAGGVPVIPYAGPEQHYKLTPEQLEQHITKRTKLVVINSPSNPTGMAYRRAELLALGEVLRKHPQVLIATDDMYEPFLWTGEPFANILMLCPDLYERTLVLNGCSKAYAMTGWRVGYVAAPAAILEGIVKVHQYGIMSAPTVAQDAALAALTGGEPHVQAMVAEYDRRRRLLVDGLNRIGLPTFEPRGAFYAFPKISSTGLSSEEFTERLLREEKVAVVPGDAFGPSGAGHVRMCYATSYEQLEEALRRIERFVTRVRAA